MGIGIIEIGLIIHLLAWITALVTIIRDSSMKGISKLLWLLAMFLVPIVGVVAYFLFGRQRKANHERTNDVSPMDCQNMPPDPGSSDDFSNINHD